MALGEGEVGEGDATSGIEYGGVSSCLTVTCLLDDGNYVGGHLSLVKASGALDSTEVIPAMYSLIQNRGVVLLHLAGDLGSWNSAFLTDPLWIGEGQAAEVNQAHVQSGVVNEYGEVVADDLGPTVCGWLGVQDCTQEDRTGAFTITLP